MTLRQGDAYKGSTDSAQPPQGTQRHAEFAHGSHGCPSRHMNRSFIRHDPNTAEGSARITVPRIVIEPDGDERTVFYVRMRSCGLHWANTRPKRGLQNVPWSQ